MVFVAIQAAIKWAGPHAEIEQGTLFFIVMPVCSTLRIRWEVMGRGDYACFYQLPRYSCNFKN